jgi:hypothetical protein
MGFYVNCASRRKNTGISRRCQDLGPIAGFILTPYGWSDTEANAKLKATYDTGISADPEDRMYPFPPTINMTNNSEETVYQEMALGRMEVKGGKFILQFAIKSSRYKHEAMKSHSGQQCGVVLYDTQNRGQGVVDGANFKCINLQDLTVERIRLNDGAGEATHTLVTMVFADPEEFESKPAVLTGLDWQFSSLEGLVDVNLDVVTGSASTAGVTITCTVDKTGEAMNPVGPETGPPITDGDIIIKNAAGVTQSLTSVTVDNGTAVIVATLASGDYTVDFYDPADMVTKGYESTGSAAFTVS